MPKGHARLDNVLFAPLVIKGKAVGLLGLANKPGGFTEYDARIASGFSELGSGIVLALPRSVVNLKSERVLCKAQTRSFSWVSLNCRSVPSD